MGRRTRPAAIAAAKAAGLSAVAMDGEAPANAGIPVIPRNGHAQMRWTANSPLWVFRMANGPGFRKRGFRPAARRICPGLIPTERSFALRGRWRPTKASGSNSTRPAGGSACRGLYAGRGGSRELRGKVGDLAGRCVARGPDREETTGHRYLEESHRRADLLRAAQAGQDLSVGWALAVVSNFAGPNWFPGEEAVNLLPRLREPYRVIARSRAAGASFDGLQAIYYVDQEPPEPPFARRS
jgi:hypothetical protein